MIAPPIGVVRRFAPFDRLCVLRGMHVNKDRCASAYSVKERRTSLKHQTISHGLPVGHIRRSRTVFIGHPFNLSVPSRARFLGSDSKKEIYFFM
jgi:hypothetical protein